MHLKYSIFQDLAVQMIKEFEKNTNSYEQEKQNLFSFFSYPSILLLLLNRLC